jgi:hypothetical protein
MLLDIPLLGCLHPSSQASARLWLRSRLCRSCVHQLLLILKKAVHDVVSTAGFHWRFKPYHSDVLVLCKVVAVFRSVFFKIIWNYTWSAYHVFIFRNSCEIHTKINRETNVISSGSYFLGLGTTVNFEGKNEFFFKYSQIQASLVNKSLIGLQFTEKRHFSP